MLKPDTILSHYTSKYGLHGMLRTQSLRATEFTRLNDSSEYTYGLSALFKAVTAKALTHVPRDLLDPHKDTLSIDAMASAEVENLRNMIKQSDGYDQLYVTSFARSERPEDTERGILTLWDRYTKNEGYCLQFSTERVLDLIESEKLRWSYAELDLIEVQYGIKTNSLKFSQLVDDLVPHALLEAYKRTGERRVAGYLNQSPPGPLPLRDILRFCASHKDPFFEDEREVRVIAFPLKVTQSRFMTGFASPKDIHTTDHIPPKRYITLAEHLLPGILPQRVLIGPKAELHQWKIDAMFPLPPQFSKPVFPLQD